MIWKLFLSLLVSVSLSFGVNLKENTVETDGVLVIVSPSDIFAKDTLYTNKKLVSCSPSIDAVFKYDSTKQLTMMPRQPLLSGTTFACNLEGSLLVSPQNDPNLSFEFTTHGFKLVGWDYFAMEKKLLLTFNDKVNLASLAQSLSISKLQNLSKTKLKYNYASNDGKKIIITLTEEVGDMMEIEILPTLKTQSGVALSQTITQPIDRYNPKPHTLNGEKSPLTFNDKPQMVSNEDGSFAVRIFTDDTFDVNAIREFIHISGVDKFQFKKDTYIEYKDREKWGVQSYYYTDIISEDFKPNATYNVILKKGLSTYQELKDDVNFTLTTGNRKKTVVFEQDKPYIASLGEIGFSSVNIDKATLIVEKITDDNYRYFINYNDGKLEDAGRFTKQLYAKDITLGNPLNEIVKQKVKLPTLIEDATHGLYRILIKYEELQSDGKVANLEASKVIFVSDIAASANLSDKQLFVSLAKLSDGGVIEGAKVELFSANNTLIAEADSDENGIAIIDKDSLLSQNPKAVVITTDDDQSFLLLDKPLGTVTRETLATVTPRYRAFVYFQSDIIRPSSTANVAIVLKDRDFISGSNLPVKLTLKDPNYEVIDESTYTTNEEGAIEYAYGFQNSDRTGRYTLSVTMGEDVIGSATVEVEAFMPPKIENSVKTSQEYCLGDGFIEAQISSRYLFGAPASGLSGGVEFTARAMSYTHKEYPDYSFTNDTIAKANQENYLQVTQEFALDSDGKTTTILPCKSELKVPSILEATITATVMDDAQPVSSYKNITLYPYAKMVGIKLNQSIIKADEKVKGVAILIDPVSGKPLEGELSIVVKKQIWHYSYSDGNYKWESETEIVDSFGVTAGGEFERVIHENGDYIIEAHDRLGGHSTSSGLEVSGWGYSNVSPRNSLKTVDITFEQKLYSKGDTIKASFKSPILEGSMLVTLEGDKVLWHQKVTITKGSAAVDIPIESDMGRGLYLHAQAIRKTDTSASIIPFRAMGYQFVTPNREASRIKMELDYNTTSPSKTLHPLNITADREALILVSVVDAGILNITEQKPPKIFEYFNLPSDALLMTFDIYDQVMHYLTEGKLIDFGADGDERRKKHLPPENLDRIKPFMLWSTFAPTHEGRVRINLDIPEFNGKATIVAIAISKDGIGVASGDFTVKDDIMIKPSYPRFLLVGDHLSIPVRVFNTTGSTKTLLLESNATANLSMVLDSTQLTIAPNSSVVVNGKLNALSEGKASLTLSTIEGGKEYANTLEINVLTPYTLQTTTYLDTTTKKAHIQIPPQYKGGKAIISISDNPIGVLHSELRYLIDYPYGCAEQVSSKIAAMYHAKPYLKEKRLLGEADNFIRQGIKQLLKYQNYYGELNYWQDAYVDGYSSIYATEVLLELDRGGFALGEDVKKKFKTTLENIANGSSAVSGKYDNPLRVYAAFVLSENGMLENSIANMLYDGGIYKEYYISWYQMAAIFKNLGNEPQADRVYAGVSHIKLDDIRKVNYVAGGRDFSSQARDIFLVFYYESKYFGKSKASFEEAQKEFNKLYSTHEKALAFKSVSAYLGAAVHAPLSLWLTVNGVKEKLDGGRVSTVELSDETITIEPISGVVHYSIEAFKELPKALKNELSPHETLSLKREFIDEKGNPIDLENIKQGTKFYSLVTLSNLDRVDNIVLSQRIPSCMEIVGKTSGNEMKTANMTLTNKDIRDDRVLLFFNLAAKTQEQYNPMTKTNTTVNVQNISTITTPLMATALGECQLPAVIAEAMYDTRINDYAQESQTVRVIDKQTARNISQNTPPLTSTSGGSLIAFVKSYYKLEEQNAHPKKYLKYFDFPIRSFFGKQNASREFFADNRTINNQEWPKKIYTITKVEVVSGSETGNYAEVVVAFDYTITKGAKERRGSAKQILTLIKSTDGFKIESIEMVR